MPSNKVKINFGGEEVEATPVEVSQSGEQWNQYLLDDGTMIKMKLVATKVLRVDNKYDKEGNPVYFVQSTNVISVAAPDNLRKNP
ncbi:MAG: hypothetical protein WC335_00300 [Candidatus Omnitrophota bacterium]|jgi:hypothetical protein